MGARLHAQHWSAAFIAVALGSCNEHSTDTQQQAGTQRQIQTATPFVIAPQFTQAGPFKEGLAAVQVGDEKTGKWGFIDKTGAFVIPAQFSGAESFSDGLAAVLIGGLQGKWGFIDKQGQYVIDPQFSTVWLPGFVDGLARVEVGSEMLDRKTGIIDKSGNFLLPPTFDTVSEFSEGLAVGNFYNFSGKNLRGPEYIDTQGKVVLAPKGVSGAGPFRDGLALASIRLGTKFKWGYINRQGKFAIPPVYDFSLGFKDGYAEAGLGTAESLSDGSARFGFINRKGDVVIPLHFSEVLDFCEGLAAVRIGDEKTGQWGFISTDGKFVVNPRFASISNFGQGLAPATEDGKKWGFINKSGAFVITPTYDGIDDFVDGYATIAIKHGGGSSDVKWGLIDTKGALVVQPISEERIVFSEGMAAVKVHGSYGYIKAPSS
jgi:WG containing repeat